MWPLRTVIAGLVLRLLCWPVLELVPLTRVLWPPVWLVNLDSYLNGSTHLVNDRVTKPAALRDVSRAALNAHLAQVPQDEHLRLLQNGDAYTRVVKAAIENGRRPWL